MSTNILPWMQTDWLEKSEDWIRAELARSQIEVIGAIGGQPHIRPWSIVLRVDTTGGLFFFKASASSLGHETALTDLLAHLLPQNTPNLLAIDLKRYWMLMRGSGVPLRDYIKAEKSIEPWREVLPHYVGLQKKMISWQPDLLAMGVMDRRISRLPGLFQELLQDEAAMLLDQPESLTTEEYQRLKKISSRFEQLCERLEGFGIPESLHHDDFHDGNIFLQDGRVIFIDWGESAITHPFFSLIVMLRSVENSLGLSPEAVELQTLRDWYLSLWSEYGSRRELMMAADLAERIGYVNRALTWHMLISQLDEEQKLEYATAVPAYLKEFLNSEDEK